MCTHGCIGFLSSVIGSELGGHLYNFDVNIDLILKCYSLFE